MLNGLCGDSQEHVRELAKYDERTDWVSGLGTCRQMCCKLVVNRIIIFLVVTC